MGNSSRVIGRASTLSALLLRLDAAFRSNRSALARLLEWLSPEPGRPYRLSGTKRTVDVVLGTLAATPAAPVVALLIVANKVLHPGEPAIFVQQRVGSYGRSLRVAKVRSMRAEGDGALGVLHDPSRVTELGRTLRRYHLDELPQLVQVVQGELSLVGIRVLPTRVYQSLKRTWSPDRFARWEEAYCEGRLGITGVHQVMRASAKDDERRFHRDMFYARRASLGLDLYLLWRTVTVLGQHRE